MVALLGKSLRTLDDHLLYLVAFLLSVKCEPKFEWETMLNKSLTNAITLVQKAPDILLWVGHPISDDSFVFDICSCLLSGLLQVSMGDPQTFGLWILGYNPLSFVSQAPPPGFKSVCALCCFHI